MATVRQRGVDHGNVVHDHPLQFLSEWSEGDSSSTHLPVRGRGVGLGLASHDNDLLFLSRVEWR